MGLRMTRGTAPATPVTNKSEIYVETTDRSLRMITDLGETIVLSALHDRFNYLANGGFDYFQRQIPGTLTTLTPGATNRSISGPDRWGVGNSVNDIQTQRIDTAAAVESGLSARMYLKLKKTVAIGKVGLSQWIETSSGFTLRDTIVRFSCKMKYSVAASMTVRLGLIVNQAAGTADAPTAAVYNAWNAVTVDPTFGASLAAVTPLTADGGTISGTGITCVLTNAWVRYGGTFLIPAGTKNIAAHVFTHNTLAVNDELNISECTLIDGAENPPWDPPSVSEEHLKCSRFFTKTFNRDTAPAQSAGANTGEFKFPALIAAASAERSPSFLFPVPMRIAPAVTTYSPLAASAEASDLTAVNACTAIAVVGITERTLSITCTGHATTAVGNVIGIHLACNAEIP